MKRVTLLSREQAEVGHKFRLLTIPEECKACRLFPVCLGKLTPGRSYRVVEVRHSMGQKCKITDGEMVPVVVEELPMVGLVPLNKALEGAVVTFEGECVGCEKCPEGVRVGDKIKIVKILGKSTCRGTHFAIVEFYALEATSLSELDGAKTSRDFSRGPPSRRLSK